MKKLNITLGISVIIIGNLFSQSLTNTGQLLQGGIDDGVKMVNAYILPLNRAMSVGLNNSNFNTLYNGDGKRFSLSFNTSLISIPTEDQTFDVNQLGLENIAAQPGNSIAQTVFGSNDSIPLYSRDSIPDTSFIPGGGNGGGLPFKSINNVDSVSIFSFSSITGSDIHLLPLAYLSFTYKFNFGNLSAEVLPYYSSETTVISWGINWQQNLSMFIPNLKDKPFTISSTIGYYSFYLRNQLDVQPDDVTVPYTLTGDAIGPYDNQELKMNFSSIYLSFQSTYTIKKFTFWGTLAYNYGFSNIKVLGRYPIYGSDPTGTASVSLTDIDDPMDESDHYSRFKAAIGTRFDISRYYIQANYTIASYGGLGIALGIRF